MAEHKTTPLMEQYLEIKQQYFDAFVFFQVGDFYELFFEDAKKASSLLSLTLTTRGKHLQEEIPLCGIPVSVAENYYLKLVKMGYKIVVCSQTTKAVPGKLVERKIDQIITPGSIISEKGLDNKDSIYTLFISEYQDYVLLLSLEFITSSINVTSIKKDTHCGNYLLEFICKNRPEEIICKKGIDNSILKTLDDAFYTYEFIENIESLLYEKLQLNCTGLIKDKYQEVFSIFSHYIHTYQPYNIKNKYNVSEFELDDFLRIDASSQSHLELIENNYSKKKEHSLYDVMDFTSTKMGERLLKKWIMLPLNNLNLILKRQEMISFLMSEQGLLEYLKKNLENLIDIERLISRIIHNRSTYLDYQRLKDIIPTLKIIYDLINHYSNRSVYFLNLFLKDYFIPYDLYDYLKKYLFESFIIEQGYMKPEADNELKELKLLLNSASQVIINFEEKTSKELNIPLKIKSVPVYGYVFEVSKDHSLILQNLGFNRVQILAGRERFINKDLKQLEYDIVHAEEKYKERDAFLYHELKNNVLKSTSSFIVISKLLAELDVYVSLTYAAKIYRLHKPELKEVGDFILKNSIHPTIFKQKNSCIPNSINMDDQSKTYIITGPNMGGKSTYMRQVALNVILAQMGSYVFADYASIPIFKKILTRLGASDYLSQGKSTFFVEMEEMAYILSQVESNSLVLLDEIGRGTSTYDGMALAYAFIYFLHNEKKGFLLCATHYHELYDLLKKDNTIIFKQAFIKKREDGEYIFTHLIMDGNASTSLGIEIAKKLGISSKIIKIAEDIQKKFE